MSMVSEDPGTTGLVWSASRSSSERRGATRPPSRRVVADWVVPHAASQLRREPGGQVGDGSSDQSTSTAHWARHVSGAHGAGPVGRHRLEKVRKLSSCRLRR